MDLHKQYVAILLLKKIKHDIFGKANKTMNFYLQYDRNLGKNFFLKNTNYIQHFPQKTELKRPGLLLFH